MLSWTPAGRVSLADRSPREDARFPTLLDETGAPMRVQPELMRHADIRTTMNVYGKAMDASKREAHGKVVRMVLAAKVA